MTEYIMPVPKESYYKFDIDKVIAKYTIKDKSPTYMGYWTKKLGNSWSDNPIDVFYQPNPNKELKHSNYFGLFVQNDIAYITNAETCFSELIQAILYKNEILVSRYRHDCVYSSDGAVAIDGGRDYTKLIGDLTGVKYLNITVHEDKFIIKDYLNNDTETKICGSLHQKSR